MQLDVNFSQLKIASAKISGLVSLVEALREANIPFDAALIEAMNFTQDNGGLVMHLDGGVTRLFLHEEQVDCFRPYDDIDRLYFES